MIIILFVTLQIYQFLFRLDFAEARDVYRQQSLAKLLFQSVPMLALALYFTMTGVEPNRDFPYASGTFADRADGTFSAEVWSAVLVLTAVCGALHLLFELSLIFMELTLHGRGTDSLIDDMLHTLSARTAFFGFRVFPGPIEPHASAVKSHPRAVGPKVHPETSGSGVPGTVASSPSYSHSHAESESEVPQQPLLLGSDSEGGNKQVSREEIHQVAAQLPKRVRFAKTTPVLLARDRIRENSAAAVASGTTTQFGVREASSVALDSARPKDEPVRTVCGHQRVRQLSDDDSALMIAETLCYFPIYRPSTGTRMGGAGSASHTQPVLSLSPETASGLGFFSLLGLAHSATGTLSHRSSHRADVVYLRVDAVEQPHHHELCMWFLACRVLACTCG